MDFFTKGMRLCQALFRYQDVDAYAFLHLGILEECIEYAQVEVRQVSDYPDLDHVFAQNLSRCCGVSHWDEDPCRFLYLAKWIHALRPIQLRDIEKDVVRFKPEFHLNDTLALKLFLFGLDPNAVPRVESSAFAVLVCSLHVYGFNEVNLARGMCLIDDSFPD